MGVIEVKWEIKQFALTGGIIWSTIMFLTTLASVTFGYATAFLNVIASIYPGYSISLVGSVIGLIYGFFDVFIGVYLFVWIYKKLGK